MTCQTRLASAVSRRGMRTRPVCPNDGFPECRRWLTLSQVSGFGLARPDSDTFGCENHGDEAKLLSCRRAAAPATLRQHSHPLLTQVSSCWTLIVYAYADRIPDYGRC